MPEALTDWQVDSETPLADRATINNLVDSAATKHGVDPRLVHSVIRQESGYDPAAVSPAGAKGVMQLMPGTAKSLGVNNEFDAGQNIEAGVKLLKRLQDKYGDTKKALAAYNAGEGAVDRAGGVPNIPETQNYVKSITNHYAATKGDDWEVASEAPIGKDAGDPWEVTAEDPIPGQAPVAATPPQVGTKNKALAARPVLSEEEYLKRVQGQGQGADFGFGDTLHGAVGAAAGARSVVTGTDISGNPIPRVRGAAEALEGTLEAATPAFATGAVHAPIIAARSIVTAMLAQKATKVALQKAGVSEDNARLAADIAGVAAGGWTVKDLVDAARKVGEPFQPGARFGRPLEGEVIPPEAAPTPTAEIKGARPPIDIKAEPAEPGTPPTPSGPEPPAPATTETTEVAKGSVFETPTGTFTVKDIAGGRVTYEKTTAAGKVIPGKLPENVFRKMVAKAAPPAPAPAASAPTPEPEPALPADAGQAEPAVVAPPTVYAEPESTPEVPQVTPPPAETAGASALPGAAIPPAAAPPVSPATPEPIPASIEPVIPRMDADIAGTHDLPRVTDLVKPGTEPPENRPQPIETADTNRPEPIAEEKTEPERKFSSTQVNLPEAIAAPVRAFGLKIPDSKLAEGGRENETHATVLYGLHSDSPEGARAAIEGHGPITAKIGKLSVFDTPDADVLKFDVQSPDLHALNAKVRGAVEHTNTHPEYVPHITVAYLKKGEGKQYAGRWVPGVSGKTVTFDKVMFSPHEGEKSEISLAKNSEIRENQGAIAASAEAKTPEFKEGDRVAWTDRRGKSLSGTIQSVYSDGTASIDTDQIMHAGGVPIGRIETVKLDQLSPTKGANGQPPARTPVATPAETPTMEASNGPVSTANRPALEGQLPEGSGQPSPSGPVDTGSPEGSQAGEPGARTGAPQRTELEPSGGTVNGVVGDAAHPERTFPPRAANVDSTRHERDYRIPDGRRLSGTPEQRARVNIDAIKVLRQVQAENRLATVQEQDILAQYMGWGAVPQIFAANKPEFQALQDELRALITPEEYSDAERSTTNAHYTGDNVVDGMWKAMENLGATPGMSWLEPAVGSGNFFGRQPAGLLQGARRIGLDKDSLTGGIAKLLYPDSGIDITAYEDAELPKDYFDGAISNVPFGDFGVHDAEFRGKPFLTNPIHNYFFAKTLGMVRPGGIIGFVTSRYTMDGYEAGHTNLRKWINDRADFLGAVRLPSGAFRENAGTEVITDIIFLRRRLPGAQPAGEQWIESNSKRLTSDRGSWAHSVNEYYTKHPEMILGKEGLQRGQFSDHDYDVKGSVTQEMLDKALASVGQVGKFQDYVPQKKSKVVAIRELNSPEQAKLGGMFFDAKGGLFRRTSKGAAEPMDVSDLAKERIRGQLAIRDARVSLTDAELADRPVPELDQKRKALNKLYDAYVAKHGPLSSQTNTSVMKGDPDAPLLVSLEKRFDKGNKKEGVAAKAEKHPLFSRRMLTPPEAPTSVSDPKDAMYIALNVKGRLDFDHMSELTGRTPEQLQHDLAGLIYQDPSSRTWQTADEYLSGSVRNKLKQARAIAKVEPQFEANAKALELAQPEDIPPGKIRALLGVTWVPLDTYTQFVNEMLAPDRPVQVHYAGGEWSLGKIEYNRYANGPQWGTARVGPVDILKDTLNLRRVKVTDRDSDGNTHTNVTETQAARAKQMEMQEHFEKWLFADVKRGDEMVRVYNDTQNDLRLRTFDGKHLTLPGMSRDAAVVRGGDLDPHQKAAVWRQIVQPNVMLAHAVGTGKTFEMIAGGMELQRLGLIKRPLYVVPNSTLTGWQNQFAALYPQKRVLVFTEKDLAKDKRQLKMAQIATGDWDAVVVPHSSFQFIPTGDDIFNEHFEKLSGQLEESITEAEAAGVDTRQIKRMQKAKERLLTSLKDRRAAEKQDRTVTWEQLGIDQLFVDESHEYKKLGFATKQGNVAGIDQNGNQKTFDLQMKVRYTQKFGRGVTFATGTPVTNTMGELYSIMKYLIEPELEARGLGRFDEWASAFGRTKEVWERKVEGGGYQVKPRFAQFVNLPELAQLFRSFADVVTSDMVDIPRPKLIGGEREAVITDLTPEQEHILEHDLQPRAAAIRANPRDALPDNMLAVYSDADKMALDIRLLDPYATDIPTSRANKVADKAKQWYDESKDVKGTQLIFSDIGVPHDKPMAFELYKDIAQKLVDRGIPRNEIAFIHDAKTKIQRDKLFQKVNDGEIRILLGSTPRMGVGVNVQDKLYGLHHVSIPHRPSDLEQREGRILRQGNQNPEVHIAYYMTRGSLDEVKYGAVVRKGKFVNDLMKGNTDVREAEDLDGMIMSLENFQAMTSGDPRVMRKMEVDAEVDRLGSVYSGWKNQQWKLRSEIAQVPGRAQWARDSADAITKDIKIRDASDGKWVVGGKTFDSNDKVQFRALDEHLKKEADKIAKLEREPDNKMGESAEVDLGTANGLKLTGLHHIYAHAAENSYVRFYAGGSVIDILDKDLATAGIQVGRRIQNRIDDLEQKRKQFEETINRVEKDKQDLEAGLQDKWPYAEKFQKLVDEQAKLIKELGGDKDDDSAAAVGESGEVADSSVEATEQEPAEEDTEGEEEETPEVSEDFKARMAQRKVGAKSPNSSTGPMGEYSSVGSGKVKVDPVNGWITGTVDGENAYSNGHFLIRGETPQGKTGRHLPDDTVAKFFQRQTELTPIRAAAFSPGEGKEVKKYVWFDDGTPIDAKYYDLFKKNYPDAEYYLGKIPGGQQSMIVAEAGGKMVGNIMPIKSATMPAVVKAVIDQPPAKKLGSERGSVKLADLDAALKAIPEKFRDKVNYSGLGAVKDVFVRNLSQLSKANPRADAAAIQLASFKARAATILHAAVGPMTKALEKSGVSLDEVFSALIQDRLNGIRGVYEDLAQQAMTDTDEELGKSYNDHLANLLDAIEGRKDLPSDLTQIAGALVENKDWDGLRAFLGDTFNHAASRVATMLEPEWFDALVDNPAVKEAVRIYREGPEKAMAEAHRVHEGIFSTALGDAFGAYFPLTPVEMPQKRASGRSLPYTKPRNVNSMFATGLSDEYDPGRAAFRKRLENSIHGSDKFAFLNVLEEEGWIEPAKAGQRTFIQPNDGKEVPGTLQEMAPKKMILKPGQKPINVPARMGIMPKWLADEVDPLLKGKDYGDPGNFVTKIINGINTYAVAGYAEPIFHGRNILGGVMQATPFIAQAIGQKGMHAFLKDWDGAIEALNLRPTEEEMAHDFIEMAKYGIVPDRFGAMSYSKAVADQMGGKKTSRISLAPLLFATNGIDIRARWLLYRVQKQLNPNATPREINDFVNLLGNYTYGLQSKAERILKSAGLSPFITAGNAAIRRGVKTWTGIGQNPYGGWKGKLLFQLTMGGIAGLILWSIIHKHATGQYPDKKKDAEIGYITLPNEYRHSPAGLFVFGKGSDKVKVNVMFWNPDFGRGARVLGIARGFRTHQMGGNAEQIAEGAATDMLDSFAQPVMGPAPRAGLAAGLGAESYLTGLRDSSGRPGPQFYPALPKKTSVFPMQIPGTNIQGKLKGLPANAAWRAAAATKEMNSFYHAIGQSTGLFPSNPDDSGDNFRRTMVNLAFPGIFKKASDAEAGAERLRRQRAGMK